MSGASQKLTTSSLLPAAFGTSFGTRGASTLDRRSTARLGVLPEDLRAADSPSQLPSHSSLPPGVPLAELFRYGILSAELEQRFHAEGSKLQLLQRDDFAGRLGTPTRSLSRSASAPASAALSRPKTAASTWSDESRDTTRARPLTREPTPPPKDSSLPVIAKPGHAVPRIALRKMTSSSSVPIAQLAVPAEVVVPVPVDGSAPLTPSERWAVRSPQSPLPAPVPVAPAAAVPAPRPVTAPQAPPARPPRSRTSATRPATAAARVQRTPAAGGPAAGRSAPLPRRSRPKAAAALRLVSLDDPAAAAPSAAAAQSPRDVPPTDASPDDSDASRGSSDLSADDFSPDATMASERSPRNADVNEGGSRPVAISVPPAARVSSTLADDPAAPDTPPDDQARSFLVRDPRSVDSSSRPAADVPSADTAAAAASVTALSNGAAPALARRFSNAPCLIEDTPTETDSHPDADLLDVDADAQPVGSAPQAYVNPSAASDGADSDSESDLDLFHGWPGREFPEDDPEPSVPGLRQRPPPEPLPLSVPSREVSPRNRGTGWSPPRAASDAVRDASAAVEEEEEQDSRWASVADSALDEVLEIVAEETLDDLITIGKIKAVEVWHHLQRLEAQAPSAAATPAASTPAGGRSRAGSSISASADPAAEPTVEAQGEAEPRLSADSAAVVIQRVWRGHRTRLACAAELQADDRLHQAPSDSPPPVELENVPGPLAPDQYRRPKSRPMLERLLMSLTPADKRRLARPSIAMPGTATAAGAADDTSSDWVRVDIRFHPLDGDKETTHPVNCWSELFHASAALSDVIDRIESHHLRNVTHYHAYRNMPVSKLENITVFLLDIASEPPESLARPLMALGCRGGPRPQPDELLVLYAIDRHRPRRPRESPATAAAGGSSSPGLGRRTPRVASPGVQRRRPGTSSSSGGVRHPRSPFSLAAEALVKSAQLRYEILKGLKPTNYIPTYRRQEKEDS